MTLRHSLDAGNTANSVLTFPLTYFYCPLRITTYVLLATDNMCTNVLMFAMLARQLTLPALRIQSNSFAPRKLQPLVCPEPRSASLFRQKGAAYPPRPSPSRRMLNVHTLKVTNSLASYHIPPTPARVDSSSRKLLRIIGSTAFSISARVRLVTVFCGRHSRLPSSHIYLRRSHKPSDAICDVRFHALEKEQPAKQHNSHANSRCRHSDSGRLPVPRERPPESINYSGHRI